MGTALSSHSVSPLALVTGASSGIGLELAKEFALHGYDLIIAAEDDEIRRAGTSLEAMGVKVEAVQVDLSHNKGNARLCEIVRARHRPLDILALNAGVGVHGDFLRENSLDDHLRLIRLNVTSAVYLAHELGRDMLKAKAGRILLTSSIASTMPGTYLSTYNASKSFLESFGEAIRAELKGTGISVTTLLPGPTETKFFTRAHMEHTRVGSHAKDDPAEVAHDGYEALMAGKDHVVAGSFKNKVQVAMGKILPDTVKAELHRRQAERTST